MVTIFCESDLVFMGLNELHPVVMSDARRVPLVAIVVKSRGPQVNPAASGVFNLDFPRRSLFNVAEFAKPFREYDLTSTNELAVN
jgi:hypothetical protein